MKSLKALVSLSSLVVCMGAASMANAYSFNPKVTGGTPFSGTGTLVAKSPTSNNLNVTCSLSVTGSIDAAGNASILTAATTGGGLCALPTITGLPWPVVPTGLSTVRVDNVGYNLPAVFPFPKSTCGLTSINGSFTPGASASLGFTNQALAGSCTITSLTITTSGATITITNP